jgi:spore coat protein U-like protein
MRNVLTALLTTGALLGAAGSASAATATATFQVSATVAKNCTVSATNLGFGTYTQGAGAVNATSTVTVGCTHKTGYTVALNGGTTALGTVAQRLMTDGVAGDPTLQYNLYTTVADATVWGDGTGSSVTQAGTGAGVLTPTNFTVFGNLPDNANNQTANTSGALGTTYTDTITVTVTY